tara:strand:- start:85380 stop:85922 length:543 start_codon:yes stop_codon:yes gene_type:complete
MKNVALLIVDVQPCFEGVIPSFDSVVKRCSFAAEAARLLEIPQMMTEQNPEKLGHTCEALATAVGDAPCFPKMAFSAFGAEGLVDCFKDKGIEHLLVAGVETPVCVYQTVLDACKQGLGVTVLRDCVGSRRQRDEATVLHTLGRTTDTVSLPSETVFYSLLGTCEHPYFRAFNELVKSYN